MKLPLPRWDELLERVKQALTQPHKPDEHQALLIVIDDADGCGKSHLASWLAWQLGIPTVHLPATIQFGGAQQIWHAPFRAGSINSR